MTSLHALRNLAARALAASVSEPCVATLSCLRSPASISPTSAARLHSALAASSTLPGALGCASSPLVHSDAGGIVTQRQWRGCSTSVQDSLQALLEKLQDRGSAPQAEKETVLADFFAEFDGEALLVEAGVIAQLQPQSALMLRHLSDIFTAGASSHKFSLQQCANILSTMTLLGHYDVHLKDALVKHCLPELKTADSHAVAALCYSLGQAGYSDHEFLRAMESYVSEKQDALEISSLARVVWMFGKAHYGGTTVANSVRALHDHAIKSSSLREAVYAMWACAMHDDYSGELTDRILDLLPSQITDLTGSELSKLAFGLAQQDVRDEGVYAKIADASLLLMGTMYPRDLAKLCYAMGEVQRDEKAFIAAMGGHVLHHLPRFTQNELDMLMSAYNRWGIHDSTVVSIAEQMHRAKLT